MKSIALLIIIANLAVPCLRAAEPGFSPAECTALLSVIAKAELHLRAEAHNAVRERVRGFIRNGGINLVEKLGGGAEVRTTVNGCTYDAGDTSWLIDLDVRWTDSVPAGAAYAVRGQLRVSADGRHCSFAKLWSSQSVKDHALFASLRGAPLVLPSLAERGK